MSARSRAAPWFRSPGARYVAECEAYRQAQPPPPPLYLGEMRVHRVVRFERCRFWEDVALGHLIGAP